jgi:hypothetical protein
LPLMKENATNTGSILSSQKRVPGQVPVLQGM